MKFKYDYEIYHRRSIRLQGYDYSQNGAYYVTICTQNRECLFENDFVKKMIHKWWNELPTKFSNVELDEFVVMPNHVHWIIFLVGADLCVCPNKKREHMNEHVGESMNEHVGESMNEHVGESMNEHVGESMNEHAGEHIGSPLHKIVQWFKTMTTNEYIQNVKHCGWKPFDKKLWQRNYYEHIIRDEKELYCKRKYIINNPFKWELDKNNSKRKLPLCHR